MSRHKITVNSCPHCHFIPLPVHITTELKLKIFGADVELFFAIHKVGSRKRCRYLGCTCKFVKSNHSMNVINIFRIICKFRSRQSSTTTCSTLNAAEAVCIRLFNLTVDSETICSDSQIFVAHLSPSNTWSISWVRGKLINYACIRPLLLGFTDVTASRLSLWPILNYI